MFRTARSPAKTLITWAAIGLWVVSAGALAQDDGSPLSSDEDVVPPHILIETQKAPEYPPAALAARFSGSVVVKAKIDTDGKVDDVEVVESTHPNVGFEEASIAAVKKWRFKPALKNGSAVDYVRTFKLNFGNVAGGSGVISNVVATAADLRVIHDTAGLAAVK